jgi:hypothetical protein
VPSVAEGGGEKAMDDHRIVPLEGFGIVGPESRRTRIQSGP